MRNCAAWLWKQWRIVLSGLLVAIFGGFVIGLACLPRHSQELVYNGKSLRFWLETVHTRGFVVPGGEAENAILQIGTNALPTLIRMISTKEESLLKNKVLERITLATRLRHEMLTADDIRWDGNGGFLVLGVAATPAVPALMNLLDNDSSPEVRSHACIALSRIGPSAYEAIPILLRHLTNDPNVEVQLLSLDAIGAIHGRPEQVVPILVANLNKSPISFNLAEHSMDALALFGKQAEPAVPLLVSLLDYTDRNPVVQKNIRARASSALLKIDPEAAARVSVQ